MKIRWKKRCSGCKKKIEKTVVQHIITADQAIKYAKKQYRDSSMSENEEYEFLKNT